MEVSTSKLRASAKLQLQGLLIEDKLAERSYSTVQAGKTKHWLVSSYGSADKSMALINISLDAIDKGSPKYKDVGLMYVALLSFNYVIINNHIEQHGR